MKKLVKIIMLPAERSGLVIIGDDERRKMYYKENQDAFIKAEAVNPQHLYLTYEEEIKKGDWTYAVGDKSLTQFNNKGAIDAYYKGLNEGKPYMKIYKVIATTNTSLTYDTAIFGNETIRNWKQLPQIPESFIKDYVEAQGNIKEVLVEYEKNNNSGGQHCPLGLDVNDDIYTIKLRPDNTVIITLK
jgi:hypothetical protein